jgi:hypothetical protein
MVQTILFIYLLYFKDFTSVKAFSIEAVYINTFLLLLYKYVDMTNSKALLKHAILTLYCNRVLNLILISLTNGLYRFPL